MNHRSRPLAKISRPRLNGVYPRRTLFRAIDRARRQSVVWLCGPAGSGKTTLAASYVDARRVRHLWYQVDASDGDAASFFHYLSLAAPARSGQPLPRLTLEEPSGLGAFARRYFEALYRRLPSPSLLVFDNFQEAPLESPLAEILRGAIAALPSGIQLLVASRTEPPPLLAGASIEVIGWDRLRLSLVEAAGIARARPRRRARRVAAETVARIHHLSDGWAAGLALFLDAAPPGDDTLFEIGDRASQRIFDYLATELFAGTDEVTRDLLLRTALLPQVTAAMATRVTGMRDAGRLLARLHRDQLFTERHGSAGGTVYRYHPLLRAFLLDRAAATFSDREMGDARRVAAEALAECGDVEDAFQLFVDAQDHPACVGLILAHAPSLMEQGRGVTLARWLAALPNDVRAGAGGFIAYWDGVTSVAAAPSRSDALLRRAFDDLRAAGDRAGACLAWAAVVRAIVFHGTDFHALDGLLTTLDEMLADDPTFPSVEIAQEVVTSTMIALSQRRPGSPECGVAARRAYDLARETAPTRWLLTSAFLMNHYCFGGDLASAATVLDLLRCSDRLDRTEPLVRLTVKTAEALYTFLRAEEAECNAAVREGFAIAADSGISIWNDQVAAVGAAVALSAGNLAAAQPMLEKMRERAQRGNPWAVGNFHFYAGWDALLRNDPARAVGATDRACAVAAEHGFSLGLALSCFASSVALDALARHDDARSRLAEALRQSEQLGSALLQHACLLVGADFAFSDGAEGEAARLLERAFSMARARGFFNGFWLPADRVARSAERALERGIEVDYVRELVRRRHLRPSGAMPDGWPCPVEVFTLGSFSLLREGAPLPTSPKSPPTVLRLLKVLISFGGRATSADLIDAVWPDADGDAGRRVLDTTLHRLRKMLGAEEAIQLSDGWLRIDATVLRSDAATFEELCLRIDRAFHAGGTSATAIDALEDRLLALYRGAFLDGETGQWALPQRDRLRERFIRALLLLVEHRRKMGALERAAELCRRGIDVDDLAERLHLALIECHSSLGRESEARRAFERCRTLFTAQGIDLSPETERIGRRLACGS